MGAGALTAIIAGFKRPSISVGPFMPGYDPSYFSRYYTVNDVQRSPLAEQHGIDNTPPQTAITNAAVLAQNSLDTISDYLGKKLHVNSWYRNNQINNLAGGSQTSDHLEALAADVQLASGNNTDILKAIAEWYIPFDQVIIYDSLTNPSRVHISYDPNKWGSEQKREILYKQGGTYTPMSYQELVSRYS